MPWKTKRACAVSICPNPAAPGKSRCAGHAKQHETAYERKRAPKTAIYRTPEWRAIRKEAIARNMIAHGVYAPVCVACNARLYEPGSIHCDHIKPHKGDMGLFLNVDNVQILCRSCHSRKTVQEDRGFGNA